MVGDVSRIIGNVKEYVYRGIQQLPIILASTSLVYTVSTGSLAHMNIFLGMSLIVPIITFVLQSLIGWSMNTIWPNSIFWKRGGGDSCNMITHSKEEKLDYFDKNSITGGSVPSYWLMQISFFIGYSMSNAIDSLLTPAEQGSSDVNHEKRNTHAIFVIVTTCIFICLILFMRFYYMRGCEGVAAGGFVLSLIGALIGSVLGYSMYKFSRACGARSSDLFGILSQILPTSSTTPNPIVCSAN